MSSDILLSANNISIVFGGLKAVSDFSCTLKKGELVAEDFEYNSGTNTWRLDPKSMKEIIDNL